MRELDIETTSKQRLTFAWLRSGEPAVLPGADGSYTTVVVAWPMAPNGDVSPHGSPMPMVVRMFEHHLHEVMWIDGSWPLVSHDVWVEQGQFNPCALTLRRAPAFVELGHHFEAIVRMLTASAGLTARTS